jgi:hypothetical protein
VAAMKPLQNFELILLYVLYLVMVDQPNRSQTWLPTLQKIENLTKNRHVKIVNLYKNFFSSETTGSI